MKIILCVLTSVLAQVPPALDPCCESCTLTDIPDGAAACFKINHPTNPNVDEDGVDCQCISGAEQQILESTSYSAILETLFTSAFRECTVGSYALPQPYSVTDDECCDTSIACTQADVDSDGTIGWTDYSAFLTAFGQPDS